MLIKPLAEAILSERTISGIAPSFEVMNIIAWPPRMNRVMNINGRLPMRIATTPRPITANSTALHATITRRLLKRSARKPAGAANTRKGNVKHADPNESAKANAASSGFIPPRIIAGISAQCALNSSFPMHITSQRNMLSFSDTKNCVATKAKKLREYTSPRPSPVCDATSSLIGSFPALTGEILRGMQPCISPRHVPLLLRSSGTPCPFPPREMGANPDYSRFHTNPKRKRGRRNELSSLALRVGMSHCAPAHE